MGKDYIHASRGCSHIPTTSDEYDYVEWTGNSACLSNNNYIQILPITVTDIAIEPENGRENYYGVPMDLAFTGFCMRRSMGSPNL